MLSKLRQGKQHPRLTEFSMFRALTECSAIPCNIVCRPKLYNIETTNVPLTLANTRYTTFLFQAVFYICRRDSTWLTSFWSWSTMATPLISRISSPGLRGLPTRLRGNLCMYTVTYVTNRQNLSIIVPYIYDARYVHTYHVLRTTPPLCRAYVCTLSGDTALYNTYMYHPLPPSLTCLSQLYTGRDS